MATARTILRHKGEEVITCGPAATVLEAAHVMNEHGIGSVVVTDGGKVVGVFTERDVLRRVVAEQQDPGTTKVRDVMTTPVITCGPDTRIDECRAVISARRIRHLPIVEGDKLVGIVTSGDIHAQHLREQQEAIDYLNSWANEGR